ncbi:MAG TPA: methionyl-tRNA formyltransferase [Deltaproteobacteria bacterium]|nr:methionyl-tRNA formyltransferase [Deltaproteobacteria bacterium]
MKIVYFGSSAFSVPSMYALRDLITHVVTKKAKPKGRGYVTEAGEVKRAAVDLQLPVIEIESFRDEASQGLRDLAPDLVVVVSFGLIIPKWFLDVPLRGAINVHPSALPKYRGPSPMQWAIWNGETETAISIIRMNERMDAGNVLFQETVPLDKEEDSRTLSERLAVRSAEILPGLVKDIEEKGIEDGAAQDDSLATYTPIIKKEMGLIDWHCSSTEILRQIRALVDWPTAYTILDGKLLKLYRGSIREAQAVGGAEPGTVVGVTKAGMDVATLDGLLTVSEVQLENKKKMSAVDFGRGYRGLVGRRLQ